MDGPRKVSAYAPASVANVGPGFDSFGFSLEGLGDTVTVERVSDTGSLEIECHDISGCGGDLPRDITRNTALVAARMMLEQVWPRGKFTVSIHKGIPVGSGLGSSSASAVAGVMAACSFLWEKRPSPHDVVRSLHLAGLAEHAVGNGYHVDNAAASLYGGFVIASVSEGGASWPTASPLIIPARWRVAVVRPYLQLRTAEARAVLEQVKDAGGLSWAGLRDSVADAAKMIVAAGRGEIVQFGQAMNNGLADRCRKPLIRGFGELKAAAHSEGSYGCCIAGAGPSVMALARDDAHAQRIGEAMQRKWRELGVESDLYVSPMGGPGAAIIGAE